MPSILSIPTRGTTVLRPRPRFGGSLRDTRPFASGASSDDPLKQTKKATQDARKHSTNPVDAASPQLRERAYTDAMGMVDQVGSQSATANKMGARPAK